MQEEICVDSHSDIDVLKIMSICSFELESDVTRLVKAQNWHPLVSTGFSIVIFKTKVSKIC